MKRLLFVLLCFICSYILNAQEIKYNTPGAGNPIIPGYFADPTIQKFGDTYYMYATTDGNGGGKGPSQVWISKDFVNWTIKPMNWPRTLFYWAPDVMKHNDKYYLYYSQPCQIYCGVSDTPVGPWENILGEDEAVLVPDRFVEMSITLDGQTFIDDDGSVYLYWGTWGIYPDHGCGVGKFNSDLKSFSDTTLIPNTQAIDFFEAPFVFKRNDIYYLTYSSGSCHDHTYRVQYATSKVGPMGPFEFEINNPILETSADSTIHGPGHHSILQEGDDYYIVYHRHNIPNSTRGMHRQIAVDKLTFDSEGRIEKVNATHKGVGYLQEDTNPYTNLAFGKKVTASTYYNEDSKPEYVNDDNNATLWRPKTTGEEWIQIDLEEVTLITRIWTQFEYPTSFYQYIIETSRDGTMWEAFADRRSNTQAGSPMVDVGKVKARYIRLTVTGTESNGQFGAIWNIKVFNQGQDEPMEIGTFNDHSTEAALPREGLIFDINADDYSMVEPIDRLLNRKDKLRGFDAYGARVPVRLKEGKSAFIFNGHQDFRSDFSLPETFTGNGMYTLMTWLYMEDLSEYEYFVDLTNAHGELEKIAIGYGENKNSGIVSHHGGYEDMGLENLDELSRWVHLTVSFDGYMEKIYLDGQLVKEKDIVLRLPTSDFITIGRKYGDSWTFKNSIHSMALYDVALEEKDIKAAFNKNIPDSPYLDKINEFNDLEDLTIDYSVQLLSPELIKITMDMEVNEKAILFLYENLTTGVNSGWTNKVEFLDQKLLPNKSYKYRVKMKDSFGNKIVLSEKEVVTAENLFRISTDSFDKSHNYLKDGLGKTIWDGIEGFDLREVDVRVSDGALRISSFDRNFQYDGKKNGPLLYQEVEGNFLVHVEIKDFQDIGTNEGGIMVRIEDENREGEEATLAYLGTFPYWNVGNMVTLITEKEKQQYINNKGSDLDRYLQIERTGNSFYFRTSSDGISWVDMPNTPLIVNTNNKIVKVGLFQVTHSENKGYVIFENYKCWQPVNFADKE